MAHATLSSETGPKNWDLLELQLANAINVGDVVPPDIDATRLPLLRIFEWNKWQVKPSELELLKPSIQLASNLVRVGMPYIATFLPPRDDMFLNIGFDDHNRDRANLCPSHIPQKDNLSEGEVAAAFDSIEKLSPFIRWQTNYEMFRAPSDLGGVSMDWIGVTRLVDEERPWGVISPEMIVAADAQSIDGNLQHRPLIIGIMGEYVTAIKNSPKDSEQHLRAVFMAAITMAHEVGHAIFHQDFRSYNPPALNEPYVGNGCSSELGISFITWIFEGFHPIGGALEGHSFVDFTAHLQWEQYYNMDIDRRPLYKTMYSISVPYIQQKLTQGWWDRLPSPKNLIEFSSKAKQQLKPQIDIGSELAPATARLPNWRYSWLTGLPRWKEEFNFRKVGFGVDDVVEGLSKAEIEWQKARQPLTGHDQMLAAKSPVELRSIQRRYRALALNEDEDEDEYDSFDFQRLPNGIHIEDGIIEKDIRRPLEGNTNFLTRIIVKYIPDDDTPPQRRRDCRHHHINDDDEDHHGQIPQIQRQENDNSSNGDGNGGSEQMNVNKFLDGISPFELASTLTRLQLYNMCIQRKISSYSTLENCVVWLHSHPAIDEDKTDMYAVQRLYNDMLSEAALDTYRDDDHAKVQLLRASLRSVGNWGWDQILEFCTQNGIDSSRSGSTEMEIEQVRQRIRTWKHNEIEKLRNSTSAGSRTDLDDAPDEIAANPENWPVEELQLFCRQNDLPDLGTKTSLITKVKAYTKLQARGGGHFHRLLQNHRTDNSGFEVYSFMAILEQSSIAALKSALFVAGKFPPEAIMTLYFRDDIWHPLREDYDPLSKYAGRDWTSLRLKVAQNSRSGPGSTRANATDVDVQPEIHFSTPIQMGESERTMASAMDVTLPVITFGDEPRPAERLKTLRDDPTIQRDIRVVVHGAQPTFSELFTTIGEQAPRLDQMVQAGGRFRGTREPVPATSGQAILDEMEDHEEGEEDRRRHLAALEEEPQPEGTPKDRYPPTGSSHTADLFHATNQTYTPPTNDIEMLD